MTDVALTQSGYNLFSITKMQSKGWKLNGDNMAIWLTKDDAVIKFDIAISTRKGTIYAGYFQRRVVNSVGNPSLSLPGWQVVPYEKAHRILGHFGEPDVRRTAKSMLWKLTGSAPVCESCAHGKARQAPLPQVTSGDPLKEGERRYYLDLLAIKPQKNRKGEIVVKAPTKPNWRMTVESQLQIKFSVFTQTKDGMVEPTLRLFNKWKGTPRNVTHLRMDNAGENKKLQTACESAEWNIGIKKFEFTPHNTPQQNSLVKVAFNTIGSRAKAMLSDANIPDLKRHLLFPRAVLLATNLDGLIPVTVSGVTASRYKHFHGEDPSYLNLLRTFGQAGVVTMKTKTSPKSENKGVTCMFVGYPKDHGERTWIMYDPLTKDSHDTRDVVFLQRMYYPRKVAKYESPGGAQLDGVVEEVDDDTPVLTATETTATNETPVAEEAKSNEEATAMEIDQSKDDEHDKGDNKPEQSTREELSAVDAYRAGASNDDDGDNLFPAIVAGREKGTMDSGDADVRRAIADAEAATIVSLHTTKDDINFVEV